MCFPVVFFGVMNIVCCHVGNIHLLGENKILFICVILFHSMTLDLKKEIFLSKNINIFFGSLLRFVIHSL